MFKYLQIMCSKYYELWCMFYKQLNLVKVGALTWWSEDSRCFRCPIWKTKNW